MRERNMIDDWAKFCMKFGRRFCIEKLFPSAIFYDMKTTIISSILTALRREKKSSCPFAPST
jgi:hypothetical protein